MFCKSPYSKIWKLLFAPHLDKFTPFFVIYGKVTEALQKHIGLDFLLFPLPFNQYQVKYADPRFSEILRKRYGSPESHFFNKKREVLAAQLAWASCLLRQKERKGPESSRWPRFEIFYLHPSLISSPPPHFLCFLAIFLLKPHGTLRIPQQWVLSLLKWSTMVPRWN